MRRIVAAIAALSLTAATAAWADGPVATSSSADPSPPQPQAPAPPLRADSAGQAPQRVAMGPCGPERVKPDGTLAKTPHGEVEAGVGTHGYRHLAGAVCQPVGQNGVISISAGTSQWGRR